MPIRGPSREELASIAAEAGLSIGDATLDAYAPLVEMVLERVERVQQLPEPSIDLTIEGSRAVSCRRPNSEVDPHNAWITRCAIGGTDSGPLTGYTVGLKDSIALAGVEMTCGSNLMEGYVPDIDATVVSRLLEAGAELRGKLNMESFAASGTGDLSDFGPVTIPGTSDHLAGGSSSGSGAAVAADDVDIALGTDQGGSCRIPAACCGVVGLKPTTGLVPYTGVFPAEPTLDHVGPLGRSVKDVAMALDVIAGQDGLDPRQPSNLDVEEYTAGLHEQIGDVDIGILEEGFGHPAGEAVVDETVKAALDALETAQISRRTVSVPSHRDAPALWTVIRYYGALQIHRQGGVGSLHGGWYDTGLAETFDKFRRARGRDFPATIKTMWLAMAHVDAAYGPALYGKAHNIVRALGDAYDEALDGADVLALPTIPMTPFERDDSLSEVDRAGRSAAVPVNTCPFDLTDHPAISIPCGTADGLPVGLMLVGRRFEDAHLLRIAAEIEGVLAPD